MPLCGRAGLAGVTRFDRLNGVKRNLKDVTESGGRRLRGFNEAVAGKKSLTDVADLRRWHVCRRTPLHYKSVIPPARLTSLSLSAA